MAVEDYQDLIDRGWRRSGKYCYKPVMSQTCCPLYTISCGATKFRLSKSQKGVLKKVAKYLVEGVGPKKVEQDTAETISGETGITGGMAVTRKSVQPGKGADPSKPPCRKAKVLRKELKEKKQQILSSSSASVADKMAGDMEGTGSKASASDDDAQIADFMKVGPDGKKPLEAFLTLPPPTKPGVSNAHKLEIKLIRSSPPSGEFKATFAEAYALFKKYQMSIHKEPEEKCEEPQYRRFLCDSPLIPLKGREGWPCDYGSYHQQYRIDGKLVAVGVFDILPKCLSSVYLFYDPDYYFLNLGVYSALRELELTRKLFLGDPETFKYYYMGYYIHSCQKMRYKGEYYPSFLLCPESYRFIPIEQCRPKLDVNKYSRFDDEAFAPEDVEQWLPQVLVLFQHTYMKYGEFCQFIPEELRQGPMVRQYAQLVGPKVAARMLLVLSQD